MQAGTSQGSDIIMKKIILGIFAATMLMGCTKSNESGYIGPSDIVIEDGVMTPEALLAMGRLSDPQISPDGTKILYGVSYTSVEKNSSCRNLFVCNADGSGKTQLTRYAKSVSNARWSNDGKKIYFIQDGQIWSAPYRDGRLGKKEKLSEVEAGIGEFKLSPDETALIYRRPRTATPPSTRPRPMLPRTSCTATGTTG